VHFGVSFILHYPLASGVFVRCAAGIVAPWAELLRCRGGGLGGPAPAALWSAPVPP